ncbi:coiled-coil domain-containing protein [Halosimplex sp. J119]
MEHVIDVEDGDAEVLERTGGGGLLARGLLADRPLAAYVESAETPRYVVRNKKQGVSIERTAGEDAVASDTGEGIVPDGDHSAAALVTDVRVLFAVGRADGDRTRSVPLSDVVDARTDDGFLGGALVLDAVDGVQYRFPTRGDLDAVREFVDAAAGTWARAERRLETAADALDRADERLDSGDVDAALDLINGARESLAAAREEAASLDGAAASLADRFDSSRARLRQYERRVHVERAERAGERAQARREDDEYEAAMDFLERADESYAAALSVDADLPTDASIERHRDLLAAERARLASAPLERARAAVEEASSADDPADAVEWWERALDRYETLLTLDWGRDERRFDGERIRERLATVAERLVDARCERARRAIDLLDDAPTSAAGAAVERAEAALDAAHDVARERAPEAVDTVEQLRNRLDEQRARVDEPVDDSGDAAVRETVVIPSAEEATDDEANDVDGDETVDADETVNAGETGDGSDTAVDDDDGYAEAGHGDAGVEETPEDVDEEIANALADAMAEEVGDSIAETVDEAIVGVDGDPAGAESPDSNDDPAEDDARDDGEESRADGEESRGDDHDEDEWVFVDGETDDEWVSATRTGTADADTEGVAAESADSDEAGSDSGVGDADADTDPLDTETRVERSGSVPTESTGSEGSGRDIPSLDADGFRSLVTRVFEATGWETEPRGESLGTTDLRATTPRPVTVTAAVLTVDAGTAAAVDPDDVDRIAEAVERDGDLDEAVVAAGGQLPEATRKRASDREVRVVDPAEIDDLVDETGVSLPGEESTES